MTETRFFADATGLPSATFADGDPITVGIGFRAPVGATITKLWYWRAATAQGDPADPAPVGQIFRVDGPGVGAPLIPGGIAFPAAAALGWQSITLPTPLVLPASSAQDYRAAVYFPGQRYTATGRYFLDGPGAGGLASGPLTAATAYVGGHYGYDTGGAAGTATYPNNSFNGGNYWVDLTADDGATGVEVVVNLADLVGLGDTASSASAVQRALVDLLGVDDGVTRQVDVARALLDPVGLAELVERAVAAEQLLVDELGVADLVARIAAAGRDLLDPVGVGDLVDTPGHVAVRGRLRTYDTAARLEASSP